MQAAEKISIIMTPEMLRLIRESVEAGEYASTSEVIRGRACRAKKSERIWTRSWKKLPKNPEMRHLKSPTARRRCSLSRISIGRYLK
jgi:Arc/MetJ-type ribon-helix-helix transcriptional regulator